MAGWTLIPDKMDDTEAKPNRFGPFLTTLIVFFFVEMGDKTQLATVALGAQYQDVSSVTSGSTLGMMLANVPAVLLGQQLLQRIEMKKVRLIAAVFFAL